MAYNTKEVVKDIDGNPISQYYNPIKDSYEPVEGSGGGNKVILYNEDGSENNNLDLNPILSTLDRLTGTVIDEETRKSNELARQSSVSAMVENESLRQSNEDSRIDVFGNQMDRVAEIKRLVPENVSNEIDTLENNIITYRQDTTNQISEFKSTVTNRVDRIDARVDDIITTPTTEISVQEIVDARHGEGSLGTNIQGVKDKLAEHRVSDTPHEFNDLENNKKYTIGFQLSEDGQPQIIYKEVI